MKKRQTVLLLLAVAMITGLLSGCGNSGTDTKTQAEADTASAEENITALSAMTAVNDGELTVLDDNYRTWYEVFVYSFYDSDGDGIGDLNGLTEKLDYINDGDSSTDTDLGCNAIWLMPVMPSATYHKYDVMDYCDIDPEYGTLEDFKAFITACHERGINVIIDLVMNHSSSQHPWFLKAEQYIRGLKEGEEPDEAACPYVDYYHFSKDVQAGYSQIEGTNWYYEAQFWGGMPDLNPGSEAVRSEFEQIVDFWLALDVDGFRLDAAKEFYTGTVDANIEVLSWFQDMVKQKKEDAYIVAEVWNDMSTYAQYYESGIDSCFDFAFADSTGIIASTIKGASGYDASSYGKALENLQETFGQYSTNYIDAPFYTNHDMARGAGYYSGEYSENQTKIAQAMNLWMSGSAFLYYGEELGMKGAGKDENKRAPMYWTKEHQAAGMCDGPKDMDAVEMKYGSLEEQAADGNSVYHFVREAIKLRNRYPQIARGIVTFEEGLSDEAVCAVRKEYNGEEILLVYNLSNEGQSVDLSGINLAGEESTEPVIGGMLVTGTDPAVLEGTNLILPSYSAVIIK